MNHVLLVEDEELILQGLKNIIDWEALGLTIIHMAHNGKEAYELWKTNAIDIIVTDISMPIMDGLTLLKKIREKDKRVRFLILSGYDDFEYARTAIRLEVEHYILKPINEEELEQALIDASNELQKIDKKNKLQLEQIEEQKQFLSGEIEGNELLNFLEQYHLTMIESCAVVVNIKLKSQDQTKIKISELVEYLGISYHGIKLQTFFYFKDELFFILFPSTSDTDGIRKFITSLQNEIELIFHNISFITISNVFSELLQISQAFREIKQLQKYLLIEGYGSCIDSSYIEGRQNKEIKIDEKLLHKMILAKDKKAIANYIEDLFINHVHTEAITTNVIYEIGIKLSLIFQNIMEEFKLSKNNAIKNMAELVEELYKADEISVIKSIFIAEAICMIENLHIEDSHYTPVIRQILSDVENNYKEDMNLKTLAYKYNMNTSYLGQIFQKEVGCSFSQYVSNIKNSKARELVLNTNMKINDIAKEVGYPDTSYFYRKFKQYYGISPSSLRELKKY